MTVRTRCLPMMALGVALVTIGVAAQDSQQRRLTPVEVATLVDTGPVAGTSGVASIHSVVLHGDPTKAGLYTIRLSVPAHTRIEAHSHRDDRTATVITGTWYIGYGPTFDTKGLKALPPGSFYTEPPAQMHFAETGDQPVMLYITGFGPTDTTYSAAKSGARDR